MRAARLAMMALLAAAPLAAQRPADRAVYLDSSGVVRWRDDRSEVALFGANYVLPTASDYRAAGYVGGNRKRMIDEDMAQFARMGWDGIRLTFWGDWEASDSAGNLIRNDHLDLLDYLIAQAKARGIYMLFSPIQLYGANWPDAQDDTTDPGFGRRFGRDRMGRDPAAIAAQVNYLTQILNHVNPYTGVALKNEPAIVFIELVNEPWHHPEDMDGSVHYINALTDAVRATGCTKLVFYNVSQDFRIGEAIRRSRAQGVTFGWYPSALVSGHEQQGNFLRAVDAYPDMLRPELARMPRIVYEFDTPDLRSGTMYPAMARTYRSVGAQFAAMFAYDMLQTASRNLGWQTHYLNLVYTPRKAMSAIIAAEAMHRLPRMRAYGAYPANTTFGDFHLSADSDLGELLARDAFMYTGSTSSTPPDPAALTRIAGVGSSPLVQYEGDGIYFLDKVRPGVWRLEVYPDAEPVRDPFEAPNPGKIVTRAITRVWHMTIALPDLGADFHVQDATGGGDIGAADGGRFRVAPGVYVLSARGAVNLATMPAAMGHVGFREIHLPPADTLDPVVVSLAPPLLTAGLDAELRVRIVDATPPDSAMLFIKPVAGGFYRGFALHPAGGYEYAASIPAAALRAGPAEFVVTLFRGGAPFTLPDGIHATPWQWDYFGRGSWKVDIVQAGTPLVLFDPGRDADKLTFTRIGDAGRRGLFQLGIAPASGRPVFHLELPVVNGEALEDYTASLVVKDLVRARDTSAAASSLRLRVRGLWMGQGIRVTLVEDDGTAWTTLVRADTAWADVDVPLASLSVGRAALLPQGFPGEWNYWIGPAADRGGADDRIRLGHVERLQLSLRRSDVSQAVSPGSYGAEIESVVVASLLRSRR